MKVLRFQSLTIMISVLLKLLIVLRNWWVLSFLRILNLIW
ncbi:hypothetical protein NC653_031509 [Populus alba x Populus x berolinensis]|nr:hypothetical protein NC653_031509 [Populus alba x Populus x berolinensis]